MRSLLFAACLLLVVTPSASANEIHIISRDGYGHFIKSQKIYDKKSRGMVSVAYCGQDYFAYPSTVAWTEYESENGRFLGVEAAAGKSWKLICRNPQEQVRYADLDGGSFLGSNWKTPSWIVNQRNNGAAKSFHTR